MVFGYTIVATLATLNSQIANISYYYAGLTVSIVTDPATEPYPAATWIRFSCHVTGNTSMVMYDWILLCSSQQPPLVVFTYENHTDVNQFDINIRSTPSSCLDTVMCNATDQSGNSGHATWRTGRVTGEQVSLFTYLQQTLGLNCVAIETAA